MAPHDSTAMVSDAEDTADTVEHAGHRLGIKRIAQGDGMALAQVDRTYGFETYPALGSIPFRNWHMQRMRAGCRGNRADNGQTGKDVVEKAN